jgi:hypothetical protein
MKCEFMYYRQMLASCKHLSNKTGWCNAYGVDKCIYLGKSCKNCGMKYGSIGYCGECKEFSGWRPENEV